jgi:hypothetical protein
MARQQANASKCTVEDTPSSRGARLERMQDGGELFAPSHPLGYCGDSLGIVSKNNGDRRQRFSLVRNETYCEERALCVSVGI